MSYKECPKILRIILVLLVYSSIPDQLYSQNFSRFNNLNDAGLIRIEFKNEKGTQIPILKQYEDRLILNVDGQAQEIKLREITRLIYDDGKFFGLYQREGFNETNPAEAEFSMYSIEGQKIWSLSEELIWDQYEPQWIVDPINGAALKIESSFGKVTYFDNDGNPMRINVFNVDEHDYERTLIGAFSPTSGYFVIAGQTQGDIGSQRSTLILFDENLRVVFEKSMIQNKLTQIKFSQDGSNIGFSGYHLNENGTIESKTTQVINKSGTLISSYSVLSQLISFSKNDRNIAFSDGKRVYYAELNTGNRIWEKQLGGDGRIITNIDISYETDGVVILSGTTKYDISTYIYENLILSLFDDKGNLLHEEEYSDNSVIEPTLQISADGRSIAVGLKSGWTLMRRLDK